MPDLVPSEDRGLSMAEARRIQQQRFLMWEKEVLQRMTRREIAADLRVTEEEVEAQRALIPTAVLQEHEVTRQTLRDAQLKDIHDNINQLRKIVNSKRKDVSATTKMAAMKEMREQYKRLAQSEGTDRHKDRVEVSGNLTGAAAVEAQAVAKILDIFQARRAKEDPEDTIDVEAL